MTNPEAAHLPPPSFNLNPLSSAQSIFSKGKRKQSAVPDLDDHGSLKCRGPRSSGSKAPQPPPAETPILHGFQVL